MSEISLGRARRAILWATGLDRRVKLPKGASGAKAAIERLGYLQMDTIAVVERAHHHQLWSRVTGYEPAILDRLLAVDRHLFEGLTHVASYIPMEDYRYHLRAMRRRHRGGRVAEWLEENAGIVEHVVDRITKEGGLSSSQFEDPPGTARPSSWFPGKACRFALERLWERGELMVSERRSGQRVYDLPERVLPGGLDTTEPPEDEVARFVVRRRLGAGGLVRAPMTTGPRRWGAVSAEALDAAINGLTSEGEAVQVEVDSARGTEYLALTRVLDETPAQPLRKRRMRILSPFDPVVAERSRVGDIFGFDYKLEAYTPAKERRFAHFTLPLLWGEEFVGRLDAKAERKARQLVARNVWLEPGVDPSDELAAALAEELGAFAAFNDCPEVRLVGTEDPELQRRLHPALAQEAAPA
jgi:hypothetical protein